MDQNQLEPENQSQIVPDPDGGVLSVGDRLSWRLQWYYEQTGEDVVEVSSPGWLLTKEKECQPYVRTGPIRGSIPLDCGFVEKPRVVIIENTTKWRGRLHPTAEQKAAVDDSHLVVLIGSELVGVLGPGMNQHFWVTPSIAAKMSIEGIGDICRMKVVIFSE